MSGGPIAVGKSLEKPYLFGIGNEINDCDVVMNCESYLSSVFVLESVLED